MHAWITIRPQTRTQNMWNLFLFHINNGYASALQLLSLRSFPVLFTKHSVSGKYPASVYKWRLKLAQFGASGGTLLCLPTHSHKILCCPKHNSVPYNALSSVDTYFQFMTDIISPETSRVFVCVCVCEYIYIYIYIYIYTILKRLLCPTCQFKDTT